MRTVMWERGKGDVEVCIGGYWNGILFVFKTSQDCLHFSKLQDPERVGAKNKQQQKSLVLKFLTWPYTKFLTY